jgi:CRP/FNR family transcriptional regulator, cyclic AMP receptor protein
MKDIIRRLERISLFANLKQDPDALARIAALMRVRSFAPGSTILREGESGDSMFILHRGALRVEKRTMSSDRFTVRNLKDDMDVFFGEIALMDDDVRSASVIATTAVQCYEMRKTDFERLCAADPRIGYAVVREIARSLAARLRKTTVDNVTLVAALIHDDDPDTR